MKPRLIIKIDKNSDRIVLLLRTLGKDEDSLELGQNGHMDKLLIADVDKFLKRNKITILSFKTIGIEGVFDDSRAAHRAIKAFLSALNIKY